MYEDNKALNNIHALERGIIDRIKGWIFMNKILDDVMLFKICFLIITSKLC